MAYSRRAAWLVAATAFLATSSANADDDFIWIEGEAAATSTMRGHGWYDSVKTNELSGGQWLSNFNGGETPVATYVVEASEQGEYQFWLRANPTQAAISVSVNDAPAKSVTFSSSEQRLNIAADGKPDLRFIAWTKADPVTLKRGRNTITVRFESKNNNHGGLDCFVFSREPFFPQGALKPGQKTGLADAGMWAFEPDRDRFSADALLDLSNLNDKPAGRLGRIARSADGADFVDGAGQPIRFWAVNTGVQHRGDLDSVQEHARWLAKRGVNMVRHHGHVAPGRGSKLTDVNQNDIEAAWRLVAAMKEHGIYTTISPYWSISVSPQPEWGLKDAGGSNLTGLLFFDEQLQAAYKSWLRQLMTTRNPHTGVPLASDPAVAIFQIQNEDSLLFWTESSIQKEQRQQLAAHFGKWLVKKYGSLASAARKWGGPATVDGDRFENNIVMPREIWHLTQSQTGPTAARLNDQLAFYTSLMRDFNTEIERFLREEIGYTGLINAGNWKTADQAKLLDAERYAYAANDVIGVNRYFNGGQHTNPTEGHKAGYLISQGDLFNGQSVLGQPAAFPLALRQVAGHPMIISESAWVPPLAYQAEGPMLVAAYSGLTGFDIFYWFSTGDIGYGTPIDKWQLSTPAQLGMFPAAALMHRMGYIQRGKPAVVEHRTPEEIFSRTASRLPEEAGFDPNRDDAARFSSSTNDGEISPLAFLVGPVEVDFDRGRDSVADLSQQLDSKNKQIRSITGQHVWNYGDRIATVDSPKAQGAIGILKRAGPINLSDISITSNDEYATAFVVSMDGEPIQQSKQLLVQVGSIARPYGWRTEPAADGMEQITALGSSPWNIVKVDATLTIQNPTLSKVTQLDANGLPINNVDATTANGSLRFDLPDDAMYLIVE